MTIAVDMGRKARKQTNKQMNVVLWILIRNAPSWGISNELPQHYVFKTEYMYNMFISGERCFLWD